MYRLWDERPGTHIATASHVFHARAPTTDATVWMHAIRFKRFTGVLPQDEYVFLPSFRRITGTDPLLCSLPRVPTRKYVEDFVCSRPLISRAGANGIMTRAPVKQE